MYLPEVLRYQTIMHNHTFAIQNMPAYFYNSTVKCQGGQNREHAGKFKHLNHRTYKGLYDTSQMFCFEDTVF